MKNTINKLNRNGRTILEWKGNDCNLDWKAIAADPHAQYAPAVPINEFRNTYKETIAQLRSEGVEPVMLSLPPVNSDQFFDSATSELDGTGKANILRWLGGRTERIQNWHETYNLEIFKMGAELGVRVIDITSAFLSRNDYRRLISEDGLHPNEIGKDVIAETIRTSLNLTPEPSFA